MFNSWIQNIDKKHAIVGTIKDMFSVWLIRNSYTW